MGELECVQGTQVCISHRTQRACGAWASSGKCGLGYSSWDLILMQAFQGSGDLKVCDPLWVFCFVWGELQILASIEFKVKVRGFFY